MDTEKIYTLQDLETTEFSGTPLAVIGHPIQHSVSPAMHNAALAQLRETDSRFIDWAYYRFDIAPEDFAQALALFHKRCFLGLNLTIPHKVQVLDLIQDVSPDAQSMGAVNTLVWNELGYDGFNTDGYGHTHIYTMHIPVTIITDNNTNMTAFGCLSFSIIFRCTGKSDIDSHDIFHVCIPNCMKPLKQ